MALAVGIDLGTTNSALAYVDEYGQPVMVKNAEGSTITPSIVCFYRGKTIVGEEAKELQKTGEPDVVAFFKRQMGTPEIVYDLGGKDWTPAALSSLILRKLKTDAEDILGETISEAVITVPAYFKNAQREATIEAGRLAGLNVLQVINEPTAAAIAYGVKAGRTHSTILVYDLGGGTFDVTLLEIGLEGIRIITSDGDYQLGGKDWDDDIVEYLATEFERRFDADPLNEMESLAELLVQAEEAKKRLSKVRSTKLSLFHGGNKGVFELNRESFEKITAHRMERTVNISLQILVNKNMSPKDVDDVLLVGGSTRMPMVSDFIKREFGKEPLKGISVDEAVALGAAIVAAQSAFEKNVSSKTFSLSGPVKAVDVTNHSLGMIALSPAGDAYVNSIILPKDTPIPCSEARPYSFRTRATGDNIIEVFVTQGEVESPADVSYIGKWALEKIPHQVGETIVDVRYAYTKSGTVDVTAALKETGAPVDVSVQPLPDDVPDRFLLPPIMEQEAIYDKLTVYMAFDLSGSMSGAPLVEAKLAANRFVDNMNLKHSKVGIIAFSDKSKVTLEATGKKKQLQKAIDALTVGETGIGNRTSPFLDVYDQLLGCEGRKVAIVLADGVWSNQDAAVRRAKKCHAQGIDVIAIGFGTADEQFLRKIASTDDASLLTTQEKLGETFCSIARVLSGDKSLAGPVEKNSKTFLSNLFSS